MPEPFKNFFNPDMIRLLGKHLQRVEPGFNRRGFVATAIRELDALELKQRSRQIQAALGRYLPADFPSACAMLLATLHPDDEADLSNQTMDEQGVRGWAVMPMADYVAELGIEHFDLSMDVLKAFTKRSSAEFAIRPFLIADTARALEYLREWSGDQNYHVRRLVSEGSRPRLPWGMRLPMFVRDPLPVLPLLETLRDDKMEYVRRSVANNLNDIAKDHPDTVSEIAKRWLKGAPRDRQRLVRHACRTLLKQGHPATLVAFGYGKPRVSVQRFALDKRRVRVGDRLTLELALKSTGSRSQSIMLDYLVYHLRANGGWSPKVFKWTTLKLAPGATASLTKAHSLQPVTTRRYYPGVHRIDVQINGQCQASSEFELTVPRG